jgi:hypothetical protein
LVNLLLLGDIWKDPIHYPSYLASDYFLLLENQLEKERRQNDSKEEYVPNDPLSPDSLNSNYYK